MGLKPILEGNKTEGYKGTHPSAPEIAWQRPPDSQDRYPCDDLFKDPFTTQAIERMLPLWETVRQADGDTDTHRAAFKNVRAPPFLQDTARNFTFSDKTRR